MRKKLMGMTMAVMIAVTGLYGAVTTVQAQGAGNIIKTEYYDASKMAGNVHTGKKALCADEILSKMKKNMKGSYTCNMKFKTEDAISYYGLDKKRIDNVAYEGNSNSSVYMDVAVIIKAKKGYVKTAQKKLQKALDQTVSYSDMYDMDSFRVKQARIFVKGNYVGMFILGKEAGATANAQKQAKQAKSEATKIDKAWKSIFGGKLKNLAKVK